MVRKNEYDVTYVTIDSLSEGVGSSQIAPLILRLSKAGLKMKLISHEKFVPSSALMDHFKLIGVDWDYLPFGSSGLIGGIQRLNNLRCKIENTFLIHARSDIPAVAGVASKEAPVLWDVRSLWADQKVMIQKNLLNSALYTSYRGLESISARNSLGMSTLTNAVVPVLQERHKTLPLLRTVVPTAVDLGIFSLDAKMPKKFRALFSGTYNQYYDLDLSRLFIKELRRQVSLETHWARPKESNTFYLGVGEDKIIPATQIEMAKLIPTYSFGVSVCKLNAGASLTAAMPTKIGEFLACGRPIVVNKGLGDMDQFIEESRIGVILDGNPSNLKRSAGELIELLNDKDTPSRCRAVAEKYFSMDVGARKYLGIYEEMKISS